MNHPINPLNDAGCDMLCDRLTEFTVAYENLHLDGCMERVERIVPVDLFNELRAYLGSMRDHISVVTDLLYGEQALLVGESLADECPPQGIERPTMLDDMLSLLDEGVIGLREFQLELDPRGISQSHPCIEPGCEHTVLFDNEPYCFTHSPDEGSEVRGYSYLVYARRAAQAADTVDGFVM